MNKLFLLLLIVFILIVLLFIPFKDNYIETYFDAVTDLEKCEKDYKELDLKKTDIDKKAQDEKDAKAAKQADEDAKKDAVIKGQISNSENELKETSQKQKDAEAKLADTNEKRADCEGKLGGMDAAIKNARECCDNETKARDLAAQDYNIALANFNQVSAANATYKNNVFNIQVSLNMKKNDLTTCMDNKTNAQNELNTVKGRMSSTSSQTSSV